MTACNASFSYVVEPQSAPQPVDRSAPMLGGTEPLRPSTAKLVERLAARISSGLDEVVPFTTLERAAQAITTSFVRQRTVGIAATRNSQLVSSTLTVARSVRVFEGPMFEGPLFEGPRDGRSTATLSALIDVARASEVLILEAPQVISDEVCEPLSPRQLLELRARAPKTLLILDLVQEELARTPLTQAALLLPGTIALRGFGALWAAEGAASVANTAFVFGAPPLVSTLARDDFSPELLARVVAEFDSSDIDRRVQCAARALRERYTPAVSRV